MSEKTSAAHALTSDDTRTQPDHHPIGDRGGESEASASRPAHHHSIDLESAIPALLVRAGAIATPPTALDHVIFLRGVPVAPWIRARPDMEVWGLWVQQLHDLSRAWGGLPRASNGIPATSVPAPNGWDEWLAQHVHIVHVRNVLDGAARLASLLDGRLDGRGAAPGQAHLIGHSVGGATILAYLAALRARVFPEPVLPLRAALTLDAAVTGLAGVWSGARSYLKRMTVDGLTGLNEWATQRGVTILTATNERDVWSHRAMADLPYLGLRLGPPFALHSQLDGTIHGWLRSTPQFVRTIWPAPALPPPSATALVPDSPLGVRRG